MERYAFELLTHLLYRGARPDRPRELADELLLSTAAVERTAAALKESGLLRAEDGLLSVTESALAALEPYRVTRAVILAAGFGSRMMPATADRPKPMVTVNGVRIIDTLLDALTAAGVRDITVVGGYRFDRLRELLARYPFLKLVENTEYERCNNISSVMAALEAIRGGCYLCEADLLLREKSLVTPYQYESNILGSYAEETDDWCYRMDDGCVTDYRKGNTCCYNYYGISYWTAADCDRLRRDFAEVWDEPGGRDRFWEFVPFVLRRDGYRVRIRPCRRQDITEIDSYEELRQLDESYGKGEGT